MTERTHEQLDKILALADSVHDGEAVVAVRKARQVLSRNGLSFGDLARAASSTGNYKSPGMLSFLSGQRDHMEAQVYHLRQQLDDLRAQLQTQDLQLDFWRRRARDLEQNAQHAQGEVERWKKLASDTANRLWDIGQTIGGDEFTAKAPLVENPTPTSVKK